MDHNIYSEVTPDIVHLAGMAQQADIIDTELFTKYDVKRGLRDLNGKGVLAGLTNMTDVRNAVIAAGADASRIETQNYNVYPQNIYDDKGRVKSKKYKCTNSMKVVVSRLDKTAAIMDAAVEAGANRIDSVDFSVSKTQEYKEEALRQATAAALRKAQIMAGTLGRSVVNVISVNEDSADVTPYRAMNVRMMAGAAADAKESTPLSPGDTKLQSRVTVVFEIG